MAIALSDGSFIYIANAADDFTSGETPPMEFAGNNLDDFEHAAGDDPGCFISVDDPDAVPAQPINEFCIA